MMLTGLITTIGASAFTSGAAVAAIQTWASRGTRKSDEAKGLHGMTREFMEDMRKDNRELNRTLLAVKNALISLTETLDEVLPHIRGITNVQLQELRRANRAAKVAAFTVPPDAN